MFLYLEFEILKTAYKGPLTNGSDHLVYMSCQHEYCKSRLVSESLSASAAKVAKSEVSQLVHSVPYILHMFLRTAPLHVICRAHGILQVLLLDLGGTLPLD